MSRESRQRRLTIVVEAPDIFSAPDFGSDTFALAGGGSTVTAVMSNAGSRTVLRNRQSNQSDTWEAISTLPYQAAIQDDRMTLASFIETKFIPGHVAYKALAGQTHYRAILKHLITPELVNRIYQREQTAKARLKAIDDWPYLDGIRLCDLTADHVRRLIQAANAARYSSQTVKHIKNVLFAIVAHAQQEGCFSGQNPAGQVKLPKVVHRKQHNLTFQQTRAILESLQHPAKEIAVFAVATDMTVTEICDLRWKHVNLSSTARYVDGDLIPAMSLAVRTSWNKAGLGYGWPAARNRNIEIQEPLLSTLGEINRKSPYRRNEDRVVSSIDESATPVSRICANELNKVGKKLGIPHLTWQVLRRARTSIAEEFLANLNSPSLGDVR